MAALAVVAAAAAGCDGLGFVAAHPPARVHHPSASASPQTGVAASPSPAPPATPAAPDTPATGVAAGPQRCHTSQLIVHFADSQGAMGHIFQRFLVANASTATCWLYGYVGMQMLDAAGRPLPTRVVRGGGAIAAQGAPTRFDLPPAQAATFVVAWGDVTVNNETTCPAAARLEITPPDELDHLTIPVSGFSLAPCNTGELDVTPVRPPGAGPA